ncbi:aminoglycoside phosphotransferase [Paenibacillus lautus]|uniref:phosphotransferase n=1 Tax=Paenibacillus lautus TaxID=1401 RepID=UPI001B02339A|nr:phosphotransferase [Paenibacillus lautus]GIO99614.1 aminoglycoside phosphotransferase [Paenibacillus lautus]
MLEQVDINSILKDLHEKGLIDNTVIATNNKTGSTDGLVYILSEQSEPKYVLKIDHSNQIILAEQFLNTHRHINLLPEILYTDPAKEYIVYSYIAGTTHTASGLKINWLTTLARELFNHYEKCLHTDQWGRLGSPVQSWHEWNIRSLEDTRHNWGSLLPIEDYYRLESIVEKISKSAENEARFLLHGDTGVHNFVFHEHSLVGVIDPSPMIGPLLYDFTYAFCSSPEDLNLETLLEAFNLLNHEPLERSRLIEEVIFQLYCRIGICIQLHPHDLEKYLKAWEYWKALLN